MTTIAESIATSLVDRYTKEILKQRFYQHKRYVVDTMNIIETTGLPIRLPVTPEDISENIVKLLIHKNGDTTSKWAKPIKGATGDLFSDREGTQEIKCFTSDGPLSFGPTERWNVIYFLDARNWITDRFILYRIPLTNTSTEWKALRMSLTQSFEDQANEKRRPRLNWNNIHKQLGPICERIFEGTFEEIIE